MQIRAYQTPPNPPMKSTNTLPLPCLLPRLVFDISDLDSVLDLLFLARTPDDMRQITHRDTEREIQRREHDGEEDPPASHGRDEGEGAAGLETHGVSAGKKEKRRKQLEKECVV